MSSLKNIGKDMMSESKFYMGYSRWDDGLGRYETWDESVERVINMHRTMYEDKMTPELDEMIHFAEDAYKNKSVLGAQRALQFGGDQIFKHMARMYNCSSTHADRPKFFQEAEYLLLAGCGVGFSVQKQHIDKLPKIKHRYEKKSKVHTVDDSIEGWADAFGVLLSTYFEDGGTFPEYIGCHVAFDFTKIRPKGAHISGGFKAPGPDGLRTALQKCEDLIEDLLRNNESPIALKPITVYDFVMHMSDAVLSGGVRRSATICMFSKDDEEMLNAKTGNWFESNPQRGRSNNSAMLLRDDLTKDEFAGIMDAVKHSGEPGFIFTDNLDFAYNPCQPEFASVLTQDGIKQFKDIDVGSVIWSGKQWTKVTHKWHTGIKPVHKYTTTRGSFVGTENHRIVENSTKIEVKDASSIDANAGPMALHHKLHLKDIMDGLVVGDGSVHAASNDKVYLYIGENDQDYFSSDISGLITGASSIKFGTAYNIRTTITANELPLTYDRTVPDRFYYGSMEKKLGFLRGLYSANGSVVAKGARVTLKGSSRVLIEQVQHMLSSVGISSYVTTNKSKDVKFENGVYTCKESYDLNVTSDRSLFAGLIGFIQQYKNEKINSNPSHSKSLNSDIKDVEYLGDFDVYDITVEADEHTYWTGGCLVSNCVEVGMLPISASGESGWQVCNLAEINGGKCTDKEILFDACKAASILSTLQAGYTEFNYLSVASKEIIEREALIGVSITGWMNNPDVLFDKSNMKKGAGIVMSTNKRVANIIGINPAARGTVVKPSGNASVVLGTASGIHGEHSPMYFRNVQMNDQDDVLHLIKDINPDMVEDSVWSNTGTDKVVAFPVVTKKGSIYKGDLLGIKQLEYVKLAQQTWIEAGTDLDLCVDKQLRHNVSNTITVDDWDEVEKYLYKNRRWFAGVSLLSAAGDKAYAQAPFTEVFTARQLLNAYGSASLFASGVIVDGLHAFNEDLWKACDTVQGWGETLDSESSGNLLKRDWVRRAEKFAENYFNSNVTSMTNCLKDCYNLHKWEGIQRTITPINFAEQMNEKSFVDVDTMGAQGCSGGACEVSF